MIAPFEWYDFVSGLQWELKQGATFEQRLAEFRDGLAPELRRELSAFFHSAATAPASDCASLESPEMDQALFLRFENGKTCAEFYTEVRAIFDR